MFYSQITFNTEKKHEHELDNKLEHFKQFFCKIVKLYICDLAH